MGVSTVLRSLQWPERQFDCTYCGATVLVEFGAYSGGPLAYDDFAKCPACGKEYWDQAEIAQLVAVRRAKDKSSHADIRP